MPDAWEYRHRLGTRDPNDGPEDSDGDGYTNVEEHLNATDPRKKTARKGPSQTKPEVQSGNEQLRHGSARQRAGEMVVYDRKDRADFARAVRASGKEICGAYYLYVRRQ